MRSVPVRTLAFARSGDKGDISNVFVIPYRESDIEILVRELSVDRVTEAYGELVDGPIERYRFDGVSALNFVMYRALDGGVIGRSLNLDIHGKSRGAILMDMEVEVGDDFEEPVAGVNEDRRP